MKIAKEDRDATNRMALQKPEVGDFWFEMVFCPYFLVVQVKGDAITVLSCLGGKPYHRPKEINARVDNGNGTWSFDYDKTMDRAWMEEIVKYSTMDNFVADVTRCGSTSRMYLEWIEFKTKKLMDELADLGPDATAYLLQTEV